MREAGRNRAGQARCLLDRFRGGCADGRVKSLEPVPCHRGFECVVDDRKRHGQFPSIGHADEGRAPGKCGALVFVLAAAMILDEFDGSHHPRLDRMIGQFEAEHQKRFLEIIDAVDAGLLIVDHPKIGWVEAGLGDGANRFRRCKNIGKAEDGTAAEARPRLQAHPCLGNDAERPFRADHHAVGAGSGARTRQAPRFNDAGRRHHADAFDEIVDMRVERREMAAGAGGDPAAKRGELEALGIVADGEIMRLDRGIDHRARGCPPRCEPPGLSHRPR